MEKNNFDFKISTDIVNKILVDCDYVNCGVRKIDGLIEKCVLDAVSLKI